MAVQSSKRFEELIVWQKSHKLVLVVYSYSKGFPKTEIYGLSSQIRRAAVSVPANIAEGFKKKTKPEKLRFYNIAQGSLEECRYYLILAQDLGYGKTYEMRQQLTEVSRLLEAYSASLRSTVY